LFAACSEFVLRFVERAYPLLLVFGIYRLTRSICYANILADVVVLLHLSDSTLSFRKLATPYRLRRCSTKEYSEREMKLLDRNTHWNRN